jgi:hypothetical protein
VFKSGILLSLSWFCFRFCFLFPSPFSSGFIFRLGVASFLIPTTDLGSFNFPFLVESCWCLVGLDGVDGRLFVLVDAAVYGFAQDQVNPELSKKSLSG